MNYISGETFKNSLASVFDSTYAFLTHAAGAKLPKEGEDFKSCFHLLDHYDRPDEFLESFLDILRVMYFNQPIGTLLLNSNPDFITSSVPKNDFVLSYLSVVSEENESFESFWDGKVLPRLSMTGCDLNSINNAFVVISSGEERYTNELFSSSSEKISIGFSTDDIFKLFGNYLYDNDDSLDSRVIVGFCKSDSLGMRLRISMWIFSTPNTNCSL